MVLLLGSGGWTSLTSEGDRREEALREAAESSRLAIEACRTDRAGHWDPESFAVAEAIYRDALTETRRQELKLRWNRDWTAARSGFALSESLALATVRRAQSERSDARERGHDALRRATTAVNRATEAARTVGLSGDARTRLSRAQLSLSEAQTHFEDADFPAVLELANRAESDADRVVDSALSLARRFTDPDLVRTWTTWVEETLGESKRTGGPAVLVFKEKNTVTLVRAGKVERTYDAELGTNRISTKLRQGDSATPEGRYRIVQKKDVGQSIYHRALLLDYPNAQDRARFERAKKERRLPTSAAIGGAIELHGHGGRGEAWTRGCVALRDADIDDLFRRVSVGTPVTIVGGDGREGEFSDLVKRFAETPEASR